MRNENPNVNLERHSFEDRLDRFLARCAAPRCQILILLALLGIALVAMELRRPYYFLQDDNRTEHMGLWLWYERSLRGGELPLYNFHQFLGTPALSLGYPHFIYPPIYASLALSRLAFGHAWGAIDILVISHLALALLGMRFWLRRLGADPLAAGFAALTWPLASMVIFSATSWWVVVGLVTYLPWCLGLATSLADGSGTARQAVGLILARIAAFSVGHFQFFLYACLAEALYFVILAWHREDRRDRHAAFRRYATGLLWTLAAVWPVVRQLWRHAAVSLERAGPMFAGKFFHGGFDLALWLRGAFDPYTTSADRHSAWATVFPYVSFCGYVTLALLAAAVFLRHWRVGEPAGAGVAVLGGLALSGALTFGLLDPLLYRLPVFDRLRWPFRANLLLTLFMVALAAMTLARLRLALESRWGGRLAVSTLLGAVFVQWATLALLYGAFPRRTFNAHEIGESPPVADPTAGLEGSFRHTRLLSAGRPPSEPWGSRVVAFEYASLWALYQVNGYGNLVSADRWRAVADLERRALVRGDPGGLERLRDWAVGGYLVAHSDPNPAVRRTVAQLASWGIPVATRDQDRTVYRDAHARPLAAFESDPGTPVPLSLGGRSLSLAIAPNSGSRRLVVAFYCDPGFEAWDATGRRLAVSGGADARTVIEVPAGVARVRLAYHEPGFSRGLWEALAMAAVACVFQLRGVRDRPSGG